jgi:hypothetical protein
MFGDFNLLLTNDEKLGGNPIEPNITTSFRNTLGHCDLQDLGYKGYKYTWTNGHQNNLLIKSRLDRFLATQDWISMFPNFVNSHLTRYKSDHSPILLDFSLFPVNRNRPKGHYNKKFEQVWTTSAYHSTLVCQTWQHQHGPLEERLHNTLNALHIWGKQTFGSIPKNIKVVQQELHTLQLQQDSQNVTQQLKDKEKELDDLLEKEEIWWSQRSRALWLAHGDRNTKFFHQKATQRRRKNKIEYIKDNQENTYTESEDIEQVFLNHFQDLFMSQATSHVAESTQLVCNRIDHDMYDQLNKDFTKDEVYQAIKEMKGLAAPGPDGLPARFYHTYWDVVGEDFTSYILNIINHDGDPQPLNNTNICLIPKKDNPSHPSDYRPISLCNVTLKTVTKTIANRLKPYMPDLISQNQSAFVSGRLISDNTIIANEVFHYLSQTTSKKGYIGIKTDMAKAYDKLE